MKLNLVVASMGLLGLVSCPVFAATVTDTTTNTNTMNQKHHASKYHHKARHHREKVREEVAERERHHERTCHEERAYREEVVAQPCHAVPVCTIPASYLVLAEMTQNVGRALPNPCYPGWFNRIALSGGINVDLGKWGNRNANYMGENYMRLSLNDAYLNVTANVNDWAKAFASISYNTATINDPTAAAPFSHLAEYDTAYENNVLSGSSHTLQLEQAYITLGNFDASPIFIQLGKQFQDFGRYEIHTITEPTTTVMSKTLATSAKIGFIASGFTGSAYVFDDPIPKIGKSSTRTNYGAALGFEMPITCDSIGWDVGVGWLYNIIGVNDIAYQVNQFNINNPAFTDQEGYHSRVGGVAAYADVITGPFYVGARYVQAVKRFNVNDLPKHGTSDLVASGDGAIPAADAKGAKPWTGEVHAGIGFCAFCDRDQTLYVGYQLSRQAVGLLLPKNRYLVGYNIDVWKNTNIAVEWDHDNAYSTGSGGTGKNTNLVSLRAAVKFY